MKTALVAIDLPEPSIREYGGGDERYIYFRDQFHFHLWDALCDGHGIGYYYREFSTKEEALDGLARTIEKTLLRTQVQFSTKSLGCRGTTSIKDPHFQSEVVTCDYCGCKSIRSKE